MAEKCNHCVSETPVMIPYAAFESTMEREDRKHKRLWITIIIVIAALIISNAGWIYYESQFEDSYQEVVQDANNGENHFIGGNAYGTADNKDA